MTNAEQIDNMQAIFKDLLRKAKVRDFLAIQEIWGWHFENFRGESFESVEWLENNFPNRNAGDALDWGILTAITHINGKAPRWQRRAAMLLIRAAHDGNWPMHHSTRSEIMSLPEIAEQVKHQSQYLGNA